MKTPEASPKVVSLALRIASSSLSKAMTAMTGPKISSFTQVMSSVQLSEAEERRRFTAGAPREAPTPQTGPDASYQEHTGT